MFSSHSGIISAASGSIISRVAGLSAFSSLLSHADIVLWLPDAFTDRLCFGFEAAVIRLRLSRVPADLSKTRRDRPGDG